ncbi:MAG: hypothetical protein IPP85_07405 [Propionivibrio sp.]|nr:hypothetical protein [Propionivibrio sp.]
MESVQALERNETYDVGDFGDVRLKKRRGTVSEHGVEADGLSSATGRKQGARGAVWSLAGE